MQAVLGQVVPMIEDAERHAPALSVADAAMDRYAGGDRAAFEVVYGELAPLLYRYALRWTRSDAAAQDASHQTFLQMIQNAEDFRAGAAVLPWAYAICRRLLIDAGRRRSREELRGDEAIGPEEASLERAADEALMWREEERRAWGCLQRLPPALREAFELVALEGLSVAHAAEVLGITPGMVKIRTHRARAALARELARTSEDSTLPPDPSPAIEP